MTPKAKIPLKEALPVASRLADLLRPACRRIEVAGSIRRRRAEVGDIEIVAIPKIEEIEVPRAQLGLFGEQPTEKKSVNRLWEAVHRLNVLHLKGGDKYQQFVFDGLKVDLFTCAEGNWGWALLVRTGSDNFSRFIAGRLNDNGYTSRDFWIESRWGSLKKIETPAEEDVFNLAKQPFLSPEKRSM